MEKVSIVVPAYNAEKTLRYCIESIREQSYKDIEIIIVDDGSADNTLSVAKKLQQNDSRIVVESKPNGGVSSARNVGLKRATGTYVTFVDADDKLKPEMIDRLLSASDADIVVSDIYQKGENKVAATDRSTIYYEKSDLKDEFSHLYEKNFFNSVCGKLYKLKKLERVFFDEGIRIGEDLLFNFKAFKKANRVAAIAYHGYIYVSNIKSATHKFDSADFEQQKILRDMASDFSKNILNSVGAEKSIDSIYLRNVVDIIVNLTTYEPHSKVHATVRNYLQDDYFVSVVEKYKVRELNFDFKRKLFVWLFQKKLIAILIGLGRFNKLRHTVESVCLQYE